MSQASQLARHVAGRETVILDPVCEGRIYVVQLYDADLSPTFSRDPLLRLRFYPQVGRPACPVDPSDNSDMSRADTPCGVPMRGSNWSKYGSGEKALANPWYDLDLSPFFAPVAGRLALVGGDSGGDDYLVAISHRPTRKGELAPRPKLTYQANAGGATLTPPRGAYAIESPSAAASVRLLYGSTRVPVSLAQGTPWPLLGASSVELVNAGPISFHLAI